MVVIFNLQNSHLLTFSSPTEEVFQVNSQNQLVTNLPVVDFHSRERNANTKATEYVTFGFSFVYWFFSLLGKFEPHCPAAIRIFFCIENCESFAIHSST